MKRTIVVSLFSSLMGFGLLLILLSAAGSAGAQSADVRSDGVRPGTVSAATPLTSTFTYQGKLTDRAGAVNGPCQMVFRLFDDPAAGGQIGSPINASVPVTNGLFTVGLDFGDGAFDGSGRWLDVQVNCGSGLETLTPRQSLTAAPYALSLRPGATISSTRPAASVLNLTNNGLDGSGLFVNAAGTGMFVNSTAGNGLVLDAAGNGVLVNAVIDGFAGSAGGNGVHIGTANTGVRVDSATGTGGTGVHVGSAATGMRVFSATGSGVLVDSAATGMRVLSATGSGVLVDSASIGVNANGTTNGVRGSSLSPDGTGVFGSNANSNGWAGGFDGKVRVTGNLGIGTFTPFPPTYPGTSPRLHVMVASPKATVATNRALAVTTNDASNPFGLDIRLTGAAAAANRAVFMQSTDFNQTANGYILLQPEGGNVGIGTATPTQGRLVVGTGVGSATLEGYGYLIDGSTPAGRIGDTVTRPYSIYASGDIAAREVDAWGVFVASDARIKNIQVRSDGAADLATLSQIEITDYTFKDVIDKGSDPLKKVIGQQVEAVYPQAVNRITGVVPDVYQKAPIKDGWVTLATDLQKGERVRLIGEKTEGIYEVLDVTSDGFRTDFAADGEAVFVYGREVKDFRSVDYEAIAMLGVSATQELNRLVQKQAAEIEALNARLAALEQAVNSGDATSRTESNSPLTPWLLFSGLGVVGLVVLRRRRVGG